MPHPAADSRLSDLLLADEGLYDRFTAYSAAFKKFARVLLREDTASRLCLADVASMTGLPVEALLAIANGTTPPPAPPAADPVDPPVRPTWLQGVAPEAPADKPDGVCRLDVRPLLEGGHEPLAEILRAVDRLAPDQVLALDATFHPVPLRRLLGRRGYLSYGQRLAAEHWRVYFRSESPGWGDEPGP